LTLAGSVREACYLKVLVTPLRAALKRAGPAPSRPLVRDTWHGALVHFSKRREVVGFRTSVIYDYVSQPLLTFPATE
jgi:hypothetical protein